MSLTAKPSPARRHRLPAEFYITMGCICLAVALAFFITMGASNEATEKFLAEGRPANAQIDKLYTAGKGTHYIRYHYSDAGGLPHSDDHAYSFDDWNRLALGQPIAIVYLASNPARSRIARMQQHMAERASPAWMWEYTALAGMLLLCIGVMINRRRPLPGNGNSYGIG